MSWVQILVAVWLAAAAFMLALLWWPRWSSNWPNRIADIVMALCWPVLAALLSIIFIRDPRRFIESAGMMWGRKS